MNEKSKKKILELLKNSTSKEKNNVMNDIYSLPERYHDEFIQEVLVDEMSLIAFSKIYSYFLDEIWNELTIKEKENMNNNLFIIIKGL